MIVLASNWSLEDLEREITKYPRPNLEDTMDRGIQVEEGMGETPSPHLDENVEKCLELVADQVHDLSIAPCRCTHCESFWCYGCFVLVSHEEGERRSILNKAISCV